jgi:hypothetical protein
LTVAIYGLGKRERSRSTANSKRARKNCKRYRQTEN